MEEHSTCRIHTPRAAVRAVAALVGQLSQQRGTELALAPTNSTEEPGHNRDTPHWAVSKYFEESSLEEWAIELLHWGSDNLDRNSNSAVGRPGNMG